MTAELAEIFCEEKGNMCVASTVGGTKLSTTMHDTGVQMTAIDRS